jgi:hypothetical protein
MRQRHQGTNVSPTRPTLRNFLIYSIQHEDSMGGKDPAVLAHKNDELIAAKNLEFTAVHLPGGLFAQGFQL